MEVGIVGGGYVLLSCNNAGATRSGEWYYQGKSNRTTWLMEGDGEAFPFDSYNLRFRIDYLTYFSENSSLSSDADKHQASFTGPEYRFLRDLWLSDDGSIPVNYVEEREVSFLVQRDPSALVVATLQFLLPIIGCYYLLGATLILDPKKQLAERLRIYLSLFVFVTTFLIAIQPFLPYRSSLSFPEFLLVNLIVSNSIFSIFSIAGNRKTPDRSYIVRLYETESFHNRWDVLASTLSLLIFAVIYANTIFGEMTVPASFFFSYGILPAYVYWHFLIIPKEQMKRNKRRYAVVAILFLVPLLLYLSFLLFL